MIYENLIVDYYEEEEQTQESENTNNAFYEFISAMSK